MNSERNKNVFGQSRWLIITMLRKQALGVKELASELNVTENAVRPHLTVLERDGLVRQKGIKQSGGKPAHIFELTDEAELLFPKAYGTLLSNMLTVLRSTHNDEEFKEVLAATGKRLSRNWPQANGNTHAKVDTAISVLNELGGLAERMIDNDTHFIKGYSCPLGDATKDHPETCYLAEVLLEDLTGLKLERCCDYEGKPKCCFKVLDSV